MPTQKASVLLYFLSGTEQKRACGGKGRRDGSVPHCFCFAYTVFFTVFKTLALASGLPIEH